MTKMVLGAVPAGYSQEKYLFPIVDGSVVEGLVLFPAWEGVGWPRLRRMVKRIPSAQCYVLNPRGYKDKEIALLQEVLGEYVSIVDLSLFS